MKILYISCHEVLEYDELRLFSELGHNLVTIGYYIEPSRLRDNCSRPPIFNLNINKELTEEFLNLNPNFDAGKPEFKSFKVTKDFINKFDVIITSFNFEELKGVYDCNSKAKLIIRSPGQPSGWYESNVLYFRNLGCKVVRFSPIEAAYTTCTDAIIRLYVDMEKYIGWVGNKSYILTFSNNMPIRPNHTNLQNYSNVTAQFDRKLHGFGNESIPFSCGSLTTENQILAYRESSVYFNTGTLPAPYTYSFIEALAVGTPIVTWGKQIGGCMLAPGHNSFEVPDLIEHGVDGFASDNFQVLADSIKELLNNRTLAETISKNGREKCKKLFSKELCIEGWKQIFKSI